MTRRHWQSLILAFSISVGFVVFATLRIHHSEQDFDIPDTSWPDSTLSAMDRMSLRLQLLSNVCRTYSDPFRPESIALTEPPRSLGVEVVYLHSTQNNKVSSVCIPHKVGSYSWGQYARNLSNPPPTWDKMDWRAKANASLRVVVVRHPMTRILSVYRMIFEDWCDKTRFLAKQWGDVVCNEENLLEAGRSEAGKSDLMNLSVTSKDFNALEFLSLMYDAHKKGQDRYMMKIWKKLHPGEKLIDPKRQLRFSFREFVHFLVNGSLLFSSNWTSTTAPGDDIINYNTISYHWAPYWRECSLCSDLTRPHMVIHMETLGEDLTMLQRTLQLPETEFPLTHTQQGGHSSNQEVAKKYFSQLTKSEIRQLYEMYKLDHEMFGYSPENFERYATDEI